MKVSIIAGALVIACGIFILLVLNESDDDKNSSMPPVNAKEWKRLGESGLQVWDVKEGEGKEATLNSVVKVHYTGWLTTGEVFDSSKARKEPATFSLDNLIKAWQFGIPGMKPGGVRRLKVPPELGYGSQDQKKIPANSTLIFEIELISADEPPTLPPLDAKEWKKLDSGLEYWDFKEGEGEAAKEGGSVTVHYTGWLTNGKKFDSSFGKDPITFPLGNVIKGWQQGIPGMKPGGIRRLKIPSELGYGKNGQGSDIPPNSTLVFEVKLIK